MSRNVLSAIYGVMVSCHEEVTRAEPYRTLAEAEAYLRHPPAFEPRSYWYADEAGEPVGFAQLGVVEGSATGEVEILVHPDARRRGYGAALLEAVCARARTTGCEVIMGSHATAAGAAFAARAGAVNRRRDVRSLLRLPLRGQAVRPVEGYTVRSWTGATPERLLDSFARAREAINDAPRATEQEWSGWDPGRVRDLEATLQRRGRELRVTVALDAHGSVAGFTELRVSLAPDAKASTEDTAVVGEHRRRGLARWIKLESVARLQRDRPDVQLVLTTNAEDNEAMLTLNRSVGFVPIAHYTTCTLDL
jgi:GNAT superfamily N-acetyltransferase